MCIMCLSLMFNPAGPHAEPALRIDPAGRPGQYPPYSSIQRVRHAATALLPRVRGGRRPSRVCDRSVNSVVENDLHALATAVRPEHADGRLELTEGQHIAHER